MVVAVADSVVVFIVIVQQQLLLHLYMLILLLFLSAVVTCSYLLNESPAVSSFRQVAEGQCHAVGIEAHHAELVAHPSQEREVRGNCVGKGWVQQLPMEFSYP